MTNRIAGSGFILIEFPTDYDFSSQATTELAKTCTAISGITISISGDELTCILNKSTRILNVTVVYTTNSNEITFSVSAIRNPTYSSQTGSIFFQAYNTSSSTPEASGSNVRITPTMGVITAVLTPENGVVGATVRNFILIDIHNF
jgi:hypothetical protein